MAARTLLASHAASLSRCSSRAARSSYWWRFWPLGRRPANGLLWASRHARRPRQWIWRRNCCPTHRLLSPLLAHRHRF